MDNLWSIIVILLIGGISFLFGRSQMKKPDSSSEPMDYTTTYLTLKEKAKREQEKKLKEVENANKDTLRNIIADNVKRLLNGKTPK